MSLTQSSLNTTCVSRRLSSILARWTGAWRIETRVENIETRVENTETRVERIESRVEQIGADIKQLQQHLPA